MSLPRRPSAAGLPTNPRGRVSTGGQLRQDIPPRPRSSASERPPPSAYPSPPPSLPSQPRGLRTQRSFAGLPTNPSGNGGRSRSLDRRAEPRYSTRSEAPPVPALPRGTRPSIDREDRRGREERGRGLPARAPSRGPARAPSRGPVHASQRSMDYQPHRRGSDALSDSASSSGGSDMFGRSPESVASSRTSLDSRDMDDKMDDGKTPAGFGSSLWGSLSGVASNLSNWYNGAPAGGEGASRSHPLTPPHTFPFLTDAPHSRGVCVPLGSGEESHLTRVMKAYYIEKARGPADLPEWLFDERERGLRSRAPEPAAPARERDPRAADLSRSATAARRAHDEYEYADARAPPPRPSRGLTLADRKASTGPAPTPASYGGGSSRRDTDYSGGEEHVTKSMTRLRQLRDAKRSATLRFADEEPDAPSAYAPPPPSRSAREPSRERAAAPPPARMATGMMPARPGARGAQAAPLGASVGVRGRQPVGLPSGVRGRA